MYAFCMPVIISLHMGHNPSAVINLLAHKWHVATWPQGWRSTSRALSRQTVHRVPDLSSWDARVLSSSVLSNSVSYHSYEQGLSFKAFDWSASFSTFILLGWQMKLTPCFSLLLLGFLSSVPGKKDHDGRHQHHQQLQQPSENSWMLWIWLDCFCSCICGTWLRHHRYFLTIFCVISFSLAKGLL